ncbi:MAG: cation:proton antiporter [Nanoarchaeota archaeon]
MNEIFATVEFQMSLLLFVAIAGYLLAARINQSAVIGEILFGMLIGPSVLGLITYTGFVEALAHIGAVILLFVVGLEFKLKDILNGKAGVIAFFGVIIPWIAGYGVAQAFGIDFKGALFVGTALTATSIAITASVLKEMGKLQTEAARVIIGAAVIDDILGLLALSFTDQLANSAVSFGVIGYVLFKCIAFLVLGVLLGQQVINPIIKRIDKSHLAKRYPELIFIFAIMVAFAYGMVAEVIGLSAIVGAFIAGVSMEGIGLRHSKHYKEGAEYLHIIFAAVFFVSLGILADARQMNMQFVIFLIVLTLVAVITKVVGCGIPALLQKRSFKESMIIGFGMSPRGEVAMIVALIGLNEGLIGQNVYVTIVLMSLLTTIITPIVLRRWMGSAVKASRT